MMKLEHLVKPIDEMSDDELLARLREIKHRREVARPAKRKIVEAVQKKETKKSVGKVTKLLDNLSQEEKIALMKQLTSGE